MHVNDSFNTYFRKAAVLLCRKYRKNMKGKGLLHAGKRGRETERKYYL
jgi:hypothetical protein